MGVVGCRLEVVVEDSWRLALPTKLVHASRPPRSSFGRDLGSTGPIKSYWLRALKSPDTAFASGVCGISATYWESWS